MKLGLSKPKIIRHDEECTHCGLCSLICPTRAFFIVKATMCVDFEPSRCIECGECVTVCPYKAIESSFLQEVNG
ncbi:MAG TPA: 4Fe-4S dicluster domain-containing protein [candidate division WOR-3 bacterium]|uniref:4Fe-4S dicluster domain-containing protein n=1 Tax=candidate division WOR-3 bacterium TaxID=2052148 RepID=A0A9C9JZY6_UNCW3|nr:4Fe-4S dicluster domain-containing protein [candidate division WOR-3 bacterium]